MRSFLNELKRRSVFRAAAAYSVVAWVTAQGSAVVLPAFDAPDWALRTVIILLFAGLPVTLLLAWIYELTPQGLRRTPKGDDSRVEDRTPRVLDSIIILGLVIAVIFTGLARDAFTDGADWLIKTAGAPVAEQETRQRLAVLPFHSANTDLASERFSHGLAADIALGLQHATDGGVIGMASTERLENQPMETRAIAELLDADWLLEGTVRRNGDSATIDVQLLQPAAGEQVLAVSYDVPFSELLDARNDIVRRVLDELPAGLHGKGEMTAEKAPVEEGSPLAPVYAEWLGMLGRLRHATPEDLAAVQGSAAELAGKAPKAGALRAAHARALVVGSMPDGAEAYVGKVEKARRLLEEAMTLSPNSLRVQHWRADIESRLSHWQGNTADYQRINTSLDHALELYPGSRRLLTAQAEHAQRFGDYPRAVQLARRALARDPLSMSLHRVLVESLAAQGRIQEATDTLANIPDVANGAELVKELELAIAMQAGDPRRARKALEELAPAGREHLAEQVRVLAALGDTDAITERLAALDGEKAEDWRTLWQAAVQGNHAQAFTTARRLLNAGEPSAARRLGTLAVQAGDNQAALEIFTPHFGGWLEGSGPLRGAVALETAPWFAHALRAAGREVDANRVLDRHLAGVLLVETELAPARRDLLLAANLLERGRKQEGLARLNASLGNGFDMGWGFYCEFAALPETVLLQPLKASGELAQLAQQIAARSEALRPAA
ncbi:MAG: hypothetical protein R3270_11335 [Gammaproteobacteria bacterium]|nr:hypothetical protein [Gammaproteobacteria bacterium]